MSNKLPTRSILLSLIVTLVYCIPVHSTQIGDGSIHGFISQGYLHSTDNNFLGNSSDGSFDINEAAFNYSQDLTEKLHAGIQVFAHNLGRHGGNHINIDWAFADYRHEDWFGLRVGKTKIPWGFHNKTRDLDVARTWIFLPQGVYDELLRDLIIASWGGSIYGLVELGFLGQLEYEGFAGGIHVDKDEPLIQNFFSTQKLAIAAAGVPVPALMDTNIVVDYLYGGQLIWTTPLEGLRVALSGLRSRVHLAFDFVNFMTPSSPNTMRSTTDVYSWVASVEFAWQELLLTAEYMQLTFPVDSVLTLPGVMPATTTRTDFPREGYYFSAEYQILDDVTVGGYYSMYHPDRTMRFMDASYYQRDYDGSIRYDLNEYCVIKGEVHRISGYGGLHELDNPDGFTKDWWVFVAKLSVSF